MSAREIQLRQRKSRQPRNDPAYIQPAQFYQSIYNWCIGIIKREVPYGSADSRLRDAWLSELWMSEPHLAGVLNGAVLIDANRGWTLVGGRNQVNRYMEIFHNLENGEGYRSYMRKAALAYRTCDIGSITEIGRDGRTGPMRTLWNVDSTKCQNTGSLKAPLSYTPSTGQTQLWQSGDFFKVVSMVSFRDELRGLGFCGVSRALELTKIMIGIISHNQEKLRARAMDGLMLLQGIDESQWKDAMTDREVQMTAKEREYFGGVFVLANMQEITATLISLSQLPDNFDLQTWTDLLMYGYALCFGYSPDEFWPVRFGSLGRGEEASVQHRMATAKGGQDFTSMWQENVQKVMPDTLLFQLDERDVEGEMQEAELNKAKIGNVNALYKGDANYQGLISREEGRQMLAEQGIIPDDWTIEVEDVTAKDDEMEARWLHSENVLRAAYQYPNEPIISYHFFPDTGRSITKTLARYGAKLVQTRSYSFPVKRQENEILWEGDGIEITEADVDKSILEARNRVDPDFAELLEAQPYE